MPLEGGPKVAFSQRAVPDNASPPPELEALSVGNFSLAVLKEKRFGKMKAQFEKEQSASGEFQRRRTPFATGFQAMAPPVIRPWLIVTTFTFHWLVHGRVGR